MTKKQFFGRE